MINKRVEKVINEQINAELFSAYLYLSMAAYFDDKDLPGFANWMRVQFQEEQFHGLKFFDYLAERGGRVILEKLETPENDWESIEEVFDAVCAHEAKITALINNLVDVATEEKDHATRSFLNWYVDEQVEEEANASAILNQVKLVGKDGRGILMIDRELGQRVYTEPAANE